MFEKGQMNQNYEVPIDRRNSIENSMDEPSSRSSSTGCDLYTAIPNSEDVKTIARQMRTMPNYFAAMAAAASMNINYPHSSVETSKNDQPYSSSSTPQERSMPRYPQNHSEERFRQNNKSTTSQLSRESSYPGEERNRSHLTEPLEMSSELHEMVS